MPAIPYSKLQLERLQRALDGDTPVPGVAIRLMPDGTGVALCDDDEAEVHVKMICGDADGTL